MKKQILFAAILFSLDATAQQLDASNEPIIGDFKQMYVCDTLTDPLSSTTGTGVTWDYSQLVGMNGETQIIEVIDPAATDSAAYFPTSTKAMNIQGSLTNYFNSSSTDRVSQGFVYEEPNFGTVLAVFSADEQVTMQYPFVVNDYFTDDFGGDLTFTFNGLPQNPSCTGASYAEIDGQGTLLLPGSTSIPNVIRYKIVDTVFTQVIFVVPLDIEFVRTQYEYYDVANSTLPLFIHTSILIEQQGSSTPLMSQTIVASSVEPTIQAGLTSSEKNNFVVHPNPSNGIINFKGDFNANANATVFDQTGRKICEIESLFNGQSTDLSNLNKGMYMVLINNNGSISSHNIVLR